MTRTRRGIRARLRHKGKRRHGRGGPEERRGEIPGARRGGQRPEIVGERSGLGDREGDAVVGKGAGRASSRSWTAEAVCSPEDAAPRMPDATLPMWGSARSEGIRRAGP